MQVSSCCRKLDGWYFFLKQPVISPQDQSWSRGASRTKMKVLVLDHKVLVLNIWSWSQSWRKSCSFSRLVVILDGSEQGTPWHFVRQKSSLPFRSHRLREPSALHAHQPQFWGYLTMGAICWATETPVKHSAYCGKLLSLGSNKPGKQTVHGLKCHLEKCHKDI